MFRFSVKNCIFKHTTANTFRWPWTRQTPLLLSAWRGAGTALLFDELFSDQ